MSSSSIPENRSPNEALSRSERSSGASRLSSADATRRSARTVSTGSSISSAISRSVGVRPSFCVSIVSVRESFTRLEFWLSGMRTDRVCSASACSTVCRIHHTA
jgi:hypothetical protein